MQLPNLRIISAGAGSGKTYRLTQELTALIKEGKVSPSGIIATTFTNKAAAELQERVRTQLLKEGMVDQANDITNALIGTVHGLGVKLLRRFAFEAGLSPHVSIMDDDDQQILFNNALSMVLHPDRVSLIEERAERLGYHKMEKKDWRLDIKGITDIARSNAFGREVLLESKEKSIAGLLDLLGPAKEEEAKILNHALEQELDLAIKRLEGNEDQTRVTTKILDFLKQAHKDIRAKQYLPWYTWARISKVKTGKKSLEYVEPLKEFAATVHEHQGFQEDITGFTSDLFDIAIEALEEYDRYKKERGLIDYIDMESSVMKLLDHPGVREVLKKEIQLLLVDEFQDTSPIQLSLFLKLAKLAGQSIWVGDPKQSIYGFRGAEPALMHGIIKATGGIDAADIQKYSWRSRSDIVHFCNTLFVRAFDQTAAEQVVLEPKRQAKAGISTFNKIDEPLGMGTAVQHWQIEVSEGKRLPGMSWFNQCLALELRDFLNSAPIIFDKESGQYRKAGVRDVAILCRSNKACEEMAQGLEAAGIQAAIAQTGLLKTREAALMVACLKYMLYAGDSLAVAEIMRLCSGKSLEHILKDRLVWVDGEEKSRGQWGKDDPNIQLLDEWRGSVGDLSSAELVDLIISILGVHRIIASWDNVPQRLANVDQFRKLALKYEAACDRIHTAASIGGFLLWLQNKSDEQSDNQGTRSSEDAVQVLTYHAAKGLEWPIVICHSLESDLKDQVWGIALEQDAKEVDLNDILGQRWIRFWANPFADQHRNTELDSRLQEHPYKFNATERALLEGHRLLYVGLTRARDYLVFPMRKKPALWLNRAWDPALPEAQMLDIGEEGLFFEWEGKKIPVDQRRSAYDRHLEVVEKSGSSVWLTMEPKANITEYPPYLLEPKKKAKSPSEIKEHVYGSVLARPEWIRQEDFEAWVMSGFQMGFSVFRKESQAQIETPAFDKRESGTYDLFNQTGLENPTPGGSSRLIGQLAQGLKYRYHAHNQRTDDAKLAQVLERDSLALAKALEGNIKSFWTFIEENFPNQKVYQSYPVTYPGKDGWWEGNIDLLVRGNKNCSIVMHMPQMSSWEDSEKSEASHHFGRTMIFCEQLQHQYPDLSIQTYWNLVTAGKWLELQW